MNSLCLSLSHTDEESGLEIVANEDLAAQRNLILFIDIYRIEQVIRNLITNAVRDLELLLYGYLLFTPILCIGR